MRAVATWCSAFGVMVSPLGAMYAESALAQGPGAAPLHIDCPPLDDENRAALEARVRAELAAAPNPAGQTTIECRGRTALVTWHAEDGRRRRADLWLEPDPTRTVDSLLDAVHSLRSADDGTLASNAAADARPAPRTATTAAIATSVNDRPAPRTDPQGLSMAAGASVELWQGSIPVGVGPAMSLRLSLSSSWTVEAAAGLAWGAGSADATRARAVRAAVGAAYTPRRWALLGLQGEAKVLTAQRTYATGDIVAHERTVAAALAYVRCRLPLGAIRIAFGPQVEVLARPIGVAVDQSEVFRIPSFVGGFQVEGEAMLLRTRSR